MTAVMKAAPLNKLLDFRWRFTHLYWIKPAKNMPEMLFEPRVEQWEVLELLYVHGHTRLAILKARQLGFSTLLALICLDWLLFRPGVNIAIVDKKAGDAHKKLEKIRFAWERLPYDVRDQYRVDIDNQSTMQIRLKVQGDTRRRIEAGESARGDTNQLLWISEWGPIQKEDPTRSDKIADGDCPSAEKGVIIVETTWRGGKSGRLYDDVVEPGQKITAKYRTRKDWKILFYPWYLDKTLVFEGDPAQIDSNCYRYLKGVEKKAKMRFTKGQALWYYKICWPKREKRYEEYPSLLEEIFMSPEPGAIFLEEMAAMVADGRIRRCPVMKGFRVWACFDIGRDDANPIVFIQVVNGEIRVVDYYCNNKESIPHYADYLTAWMGRHGVANLRVVLPHDGGKTSYNDGLKRSEKFAECGHPDAIVINRIPRLWDGIDMVRDVMPYVVFDDERCNRTIEHAVGKKFPSLVDCMNRYRSIEIKDGKNSSREPIHDMYSHGTSALRTFCEGWQTGRIVVHSSPRRKIRVQSGPGVLQDENFAPGRRKVVTPWGNLDQ